MPYLLAAIIVIVYVPILLVSYKYERPTTVYYIMATISVIIIMHLASTVSEASKSPDPQAEMGLGLYLMAAIGLFTILTIAAIILFIYRLK